MVTSIVLWGHKRLIGVVIIIIIIIIITAVVVILVTVVMAIIRTVVVAIIAVLRCFAPRIVLITAVVMLMVILILGLVAASTTIQLFGKGLERLQTFFHWLFTAVCILLVILVTFTA